MSRVRQGAAEQLQLIRTPDEPAPARSAQTIGDRLARLRGVTTHPARPSYRPWIHQVPPATKRPRYEAAAGGTP